MIINEMFNSNSIKEINNTINNLEVVGCVDKFISYLESYANDRNKQINLFERQYMSRLCNNVNELLCNIYITRHFNKSKEELLDIISYWYKDGYYGTNDQIENNGLRDTMNFNDADAYEHIKSYMIETLEDYITEATRTKAEERIKRTEEEIARIEKSIQDSTEKLEKSYKLLQELNRD